MTVKTVVEKRSPDATSTLDFLVSYWDKLLRGFYIGGAKYAMKILPGFQMFKHSSSSTTGEVWQRPGSSSMKGLVNINEPTKMRLSNYRINPAGTALSDDTEKNGRWTSDTGGHLL